MKLYKALKLRKGLLGEIVKLKQQIKEKNSYLIGSKNAENFDMQKNYEMLLSKIDELTSLKYVIGEANREIQHKIYVMGEYKALIAFWNEVPVVEGTQEARYGEAIREYNIHFNEIKRNNIIAEFQKRVDALQDEIDVFNHTTEIPWGDMEENEEIEPNK